MKLNLLPKSVARASAARSAMVLSGIIAVASILLAVGMITQSNKALEDAKAEAERWKKPAADAVALAQQADTILASATGIDRNIKLAKAMEEHVPKYLDLYEDVFPYIPSFFRITSINATPASATSVTVTMNGAVRTMQQYSDILLAMLRIPGIANVQRTGFSDRDTMFVPGLTLNDQIGTPVKPGEASLPSDPIARMNALIQRASAEPRGYRGIPGYGDEARVAGAMPDWTPLTLTLSINNKNIQAPNPRATIQAAGAAPAAAAGGGGAPAGTAPPARGVQTPGAGQAN